MRTHARTSDRPLVVLVHGFAGSSDVFTDDSRSAYCQVLSEAGFDVLTFDNFGHGHSDGPDIVYSVELFCSQLCELLLSLQVQSPFDLVGLRYVTSRLVTAQQLITLRVQGEMLCLSTLCPHVHKRSWRAM
jgi:pimeloyl-ACP methyl ester carboxylesterase